MRKLIFLDEKYQNIINISLAAFLILFLIFFYIPNARDVARTKNNMRIAEEDLALTRAAVGDIDKLNEVIELRKREFAMIEQRLPNKSKISSIVSEFTTLARESSVNLLGIKPSEVKPLFDAAQKPIVLGSRQLEGLEVTLKLQAPYRSIAEYIKKLQDSLNLIATIDTVSVASNASIKPKLDATLTFTVYMREG